MLRTQGRASVLSPRSRWDKEKNAETGKEFVPTDVIMPQLGESIAEGTIVKWLIPPGGRVEKDQSLLEVETDKVSL